MEQTLEAFCSCTLMCPQHSHRRVVWRLTTPHNRSSASNALLAKALTSGDTMRTVAPTNNTEVSVSSPPG